jgi:hypothetical protein
MIRNQFLIICLFVAACDAPAPNETTIGPSPELPPPHNEKVAWRECSSDDTNFLGNKWWG